MCKLQGTHTSLNSEWNFKRLHLGVDIGSMPRSNPTCAFPLTWASEPVENKRPAPPNPVLWAALSCKRTHTFMHTYKHICTHLQPSTPTRPHTCWRAYKRLSSNMHQLSAQSPRMGRDHLEVLSECFSLLSLHMGIHVGFHPSQTDFHETLFLMAPAFPSVTVFSPRQNSSLRYPSCRCYCDLFFQRLFWAIHTLPLPLITKDIGKFIGPSGQERAKPRTGSQPWAPSLVCSNQWCSGSSAMAKARDQYCDIRAHRSRTSSPNTQWPAKPLSEDAHEPHNPTVMSGFICQV